MSDCGSVKLPVKRLHWCKKCRLKGKLKYLEEIHEGYQTDKSHRAQENM